jgi:Rha family phage regulatory protein
MAKLMTPELYDAIVAALAKGDRSQHKIARDLDTSQGQISRVARGVIKRPQANESAPNDGSEPGLPEPIVFDRNGIVVADSRDVSAYFEKRHADVLRAIDDLIEPLTNAKLRSLFFVPRTYLDSKGEERRAFEITKDGFALLGMGFTGGKALRFKIKYIDRYNAMEQALRMPVNGAGMDRAWLEDRFNRLESGMVGSDSRAAARDAAIRKEIPYILIRNSDYIAAHAGSAARTIMSRMRKTYGEGKAPPKEGHPRRSWTTCSHHPADPTPHPGGKRQGILLPPPGWTLTNSRIMTMRIGNITLNLTLKLTPAIRMDPLRPGMLRSRRGSMDSSRRPAIPRI